MIDIQNISKYYGTTRALDKVSLSVERGELFGLIGPDGAGKTTLFRIIATLLLADEGSAFLNGLDIVKDYKKIRTQIGYMPGRFSLYQDLSVEENIIFFASVFGTTVSENYDLIEDIYKHIEPFKNRPAGKLSGGMKQKLALSCALIHKPEILILDEPTTGVDAVSRMEFWQMLKQLQQKGITIIVSTPYMDEASLCDRVGLIQKGRLLSVDTPAGITDSFTKKLVAVKADNKYKLLTDLQKYDNTSSVYSFGEYLHLTTKDNFADIGEVESFLKQKGHSSVELKFIKADIEDCFMEMSAEGVS